MISLHVKALMWKNYKIHHEGKEKAFWCHFFCIPLLFAVLFYFTFGKVGMVCETSWLSPFSSWVLFSHRYPLHSRNLLKIEVHEEDSLGNPKWKDEVDWE